ncbi:hypothetical protein HK097_009284 [Rhizophlyctis rosea]|uniref:Uncharacterized protein n=1 Tax=Rhizophlyctis rosea TaxID=64517 RepID=A0AAD5SKW0_9FUNG|nr:hypothetical protein HK097_009284 [Rhizophlyctis rosea]
MHNKPHVVHPNVADTNPAHPSLGERIEGTAERTIGHMLPGTNLGHELKAEGARHKGDYEKEARALSEMSKEQVDVPVGQYVKGLAERAAGHMLPGTQIGHELKAKGALDKGDIHKAEKAASHLKDPARVPAGLRQDPL